MRLTNAALSSSLKAVMNGSSVPVSALTNSIHEFQFLSYTLPVCGSTDVAINVDSSSLLLADMACPALPLAMDLPFNPLGAVAVAAYTPVLLPPAASGLWGPTAGFSFITPPLAAPLTVVPLDVPVLCALPAMRTAFAVIRTAAHLSLMLEAFVLVPAMGACMGKRKVGMQC